MNTKMSSDARWVTSPFASPEPYATSPDSERLAPLAAKILKSQDFTRCQELLPNVMTRQEFNEACAYFNDQEPSVRPRVARALLILGNYVRPLLQESAHEEIGAKAWNAIFSLDRFLREHALTLPDFDRIIVTVLSRLGDLDPDATLVDLRRGRDTLHFVSTPKLRDPLKRHFLSHRFA